MSGDIPSLICNVNYKSPCIRISLDASWWDKTRWFANHFSDLFELELMLQNDFCKNRPLTFHDHWSLEAKPLTRPKNGWNYVEKESKRLWNVFLHLSWLSSSRGTDWFGQKMSESLEFDPFLPLVTSFLIWDKNDLIMSARSCFTVFNTVCHLSLRCAVYEIFGF